MGHIVACPGRRLPRGRRLVRRKKVLPSLDNITPVCRLTVYLGAPEFTHKVPAAAWDSVCVCVSVYLTVTHSVPQQKGGGGARFARSLHCERRVGGVLYQSNTHFISLYFTASITQQVPPTQTLCVWEAPVGGH